MLSPRQQILSLARCGCLVVVEEGPFYVVEPPMPLKLDLVLRVAVRCCCCLLFVYAEEVGRALTEVARR